ncbi:hypothetical protein S83_008801 [Arachis hypogaea]
MQKQKLKPDAYKNHSLSSFLPRLVTIFYFACFPCTSGCSIQQLCKFHFIRVHISQRLNCSRVKLLCCMGCLCAKT